MVNFEFTSTLSPYIDGLIKEKRALGYKYDAEAYVLRRLDAYWKNEGYGSPEISMDRIEGWLARRENEGTSSTCMRAYTLKQLARYMNARGINACIPLVKEKRTRPVIHVLSLEEIKVLFDVIDDYKPGRPSTDTLRMSYEYRVLFRLILTTGLRRSEAAYIKTEDINFNDNAISILAAKGARDRIVYMPDDMAEMLKGYMELMDSMTGGTNRWLFPGLDSKSHISSEGLSERFSKFWKKTSVSASGGKAPTVHALRHTYVVLRINRWMEEGANLNVMLPYLSRQLGHRSPSETYYYYHQVAEAFSIIRNKDTYVSDVIPEVRVR